MSRLEIWAAAPTPYDAQGRLDVSLVAEQAAQMVAGGARGALVAGTTGEFAALSAAERRELVEAWARARPEGFGLAAHVGANDLAEAQDLAAHAEGHGVDLIAAVAPFYGEARTVLPVVRHLASIAAAAPATALCYYHIPSMTRSTHLPADVVSAAAERIPTLRSVKFTDEDLLEYDRVRETGVGVFFGRDELLPAGLAFGVEAVIGSLFTAFAALAHRVVDAFDAGDHRRAFELHRPFREIAAASATYGGLGFVKEVLNAIGPDCGRPRTPWGPLDDDALAAARSLAKRLRDETAALMEQTGA